MQYTRKPSVIRALVASARHLCERKMDEAAAGTQSKRSVFAATMVLEGVYAYLRIWGDEPSGNAAAPPHLTIRMPTAPPVEINSEVCDFSGSEHGPN